MIHHKEALVAQHTYVGNPGYVHNLASGVKSLHPGDVVELTEDEAAMYGDTFEAAKSSKSSKSTSAPVAANTEGAKP